VDKYQPCRVGIGMLENLKVNGGTIELYELKRHRQSFADDAAYGLTTYVVKMSVQLLPLILYSIDLFL
jgi:hypothetical protein